jgi:putative inorganic carbon (HCO3(-)) transporter
MEWLIAIGVVLPAAWLAAKRSSWLVDYSVYVFVFNRGLRRIVDFHINGAFNPLSPISLTPLVVALLMGLVVFTHQKFLPRYAKGIGSLFLAAYAFSGAVGFVRTQFAVFYAAAEVLAPLFLMLYAILLNPPTGVRDRWIRAFSWGAILVSAYGWYQYVVVPPWDKFWLIATEMVGYMGQPEPYQMSVFSTMGERGVVGAYLGYSVVPMIVSKKWRTAAGWLGVLLVFSAILLTLTRGGLLIAIISTAIFVVINKGAKTGQVLVAAVILSLGSVYGIAKIPNSERIMDRYESLQKLGDDGSVEARQDIIKLQAGNLLSNPLGYGLGGTGLATRVNTGATKVKSAIADAGYLDIVMTFGIPGSILILLGMLKIWKQLKLRYRNPQYRTDYVLLARALMASLVVTCLLGNLLTVFSVLWLAMGTGLAIRAAGPMAGHGSRLAGNGSASVQSISGVTRGRRAGALLAAGHAAARERRKG